MKGVCLGLVQRCMFSFELDVSKRPFTMQYHPYEEFVRGGGLLTYDDDSNYALFMVLYAAHSRPAVLGHSLLQCKSGVEHSCITIVCLYHSLKQRATINKSQQDNVCSIQLGSSRERLKFV